MADKYQNKYRIPSARLQSWDYGSNAAYFITICTKNREHFFGEITEGKMQLTEPGKMANHCWSEIPGHFPFVILDEFIVMPNHIHGIIVIDNPVNDVVDNPGGNVAGNIVPNVAGNVAGNVTSNGEGNVVPNVAGNGAPDVAGNVAANVAGNLGGNVAGNVETGHALSLHALSLQPSPQSNQTKKHHPRFRNQGKNTISAMVGSFKSTVTKWCNDNKFPFGWQSRFHDHIIRDNDEFERIRNYIINNPANWKEDKFYEPFSG